MNIQLNILQNWLVEQSVDAAFINDPSTVAYLSGYESEPHERILALAVFATGKPFLFTPELEKEDAIKSEWSHDVYGYLDNEDPWALIAKYFQSHSSNGLKNIAIEKDFLTVGRFEKLQAFFPTLSFIDITPKIQTMKLIKTPDEINKMMEAGKWADRAFEIGFSAIKEGISEEEIVAEIEYRLKKEGIKEMSFETMVLTGDNAASPHGTPGKRQVQLNEFVLFDLGVVHNGYTSDATRTIAFGEPSKQAKEIYAIVLEAHNAALAAVKPGITAGKLDKIARTIITEAGFGSYFTHRLGHGLGSSVHEFPSIMQDSDFVIQEGMCFSIEPGIYVPGIAGVRIEDCVVVTKDGCEVFTHTPKTYTSI
ncbi:M24 family metallopeptidase [Carnobacterium inhibens]|uniref:Dipeptidase n=1 Tax=Carnobacterium inhibens subsp. gilichinskyi TaxID=1266845 RepID=U5S7L4_9LACT|nr:Xaa-Pro peptidase family protein [Carnobacterium inhibens]AGY81219.1 dipeptidase [Carnobacterium inhibens subsp. gilichinskyi]